jgi:hypothetical protein
LWDSEIDVVDGLDIAESFADTVGFDRVGHCCLSGAVKVTSETSSKLTER